MTALSSSRTRGGRRLKVCHNARCHEVFFDQSKNNSRTWFDTAARADALNLRAYPRTADGRAIF